jgi:hypothetical protein
MHSQLNPNSGIASVLSERLPMAKSEDISLVKDGRDFYVVVDGVKVAKRGYPGTPQAGTWVSIEPGWEVVGGPESIAVSYGRASVN